MEAEEGVEAEGPVLPRGGAVAVTDVSRLSNQGRGDKQQDVLTASMNAV